MVEAVIPARGVNTLGEVPDSSWYTNRHYLHPMSIGELVRGPGNENPPAMDGPWRVVAAKTEGITPGFAILDPRGRKYIMKFDPYDYPELATGADVVASKFLYALGYNVPENYIVHFERRQLVIGDNTMVTDRNGKRRRMHEGDLADILRRVRQSGDGRYRAMASRYLPGQPLGPFRYYGTRRDDPNDTVPHEHRRDLRGLRVICAWLDHDDSRAGNTLDMLVEENGTRFIKHYLIDFGSTLGSDSIGPNSPRSGNEYLFAWKPAALQFLTFGFYTPAWQRVNYPDLPAAGRFEARVFDPDRWLPRYPNPAFANMNADDAFWAARQVMAFTDEQIRAIVETGMYSDPAAKEWIVRCLIARRDKIGKAYFGRVLPLDRFRIHAGILEFDDLGPSPSSYQARWSLFDNHTGLKTPISGRPSFALPILAAEPAGPVYLLAEIFVSDPNQTVSVYVRVEKGRQEVVGCERTWEPEARP
jgi:hypothetical protein